MVHGHLHRAQMSFPVHFTAPDHSRTYIGETVDISSTGFSVQVKSDQPLPPIILAGILPSRVAGDAILCKARVVWQGGIVNGMGRASYKIISIAQKSQERLDQLIQKSLLELLDQLLEFPIFQECDRADLKTLLALARTRDATPGTVLYEAGKEDDSGTYIVLKGSIGVSRPPAAPVVCGPGSVVGRWYTPEPLMNEETAQVLSEARYLYVPLALLPEVQRRTPIIASVLYGALGQASPPVSPQPPTERRRPARVHLPHDLQEIPTLPTIFNSVMDCIESRDACPRDLAQILRKDQALSAKILKTINSAFYGFAGQITSVHEAVVLLGMRQTANLAVTAMLLNTLVDENDHSRRPEEFWEHSLGSAHFSQLIARQMLGLARISLTAPAMAASAGGGGATIADAPASNGGGGGGPAVRPRCGLSGPRTGRIDDLDHLFTYAILHDIGLLVLYLKFPDQFSMVQDMIPQCGSLHRAELELLEIDHCQLGYRVAKAWRLPEPIPTIIAEHHLPQVWAQRLDDRHELLTLLQEEPAVTLISMADLLTRRAGIGIEMDLTPPEIPEALLESLGITPEHVEGWLAQGPAIREKAEQFFRGLNG